MQTDDEHIPKGAITLQRLSRSFETTDDISDTHRRSTDWAIDAADEPRQTSHSTMETELTTKPAAVLDRKDYSDLEVVVDIPQTWHSNDKMPVLFDSSEKIASVDNNALLSPSLADPVPAYPASLHSRTSTLANTPLTKGGDYTEVAHQDAESTRSAGKKTWGMSNKQLSWVATGLLGFILMLLATVLAITLSMDKGKSAQGTAAGVVNGDGLLNTSSLAAINWTDSTGLDRSMVFYQSSGNSILVSIRDSASNEWAQTNITEAVMKSTGAKRLDVLHNTPLAAVTNSWQVSLYYLTTSNSISEIWSSDVAGGVWYAGSLATDLGPVAGNGSRLAAYWQGCTNCTNSLLVLHQQTDGNLMLANFTNNSWELSGPLTSSASQVVNETGLAIRPFTETNNTLGMEPSGWKAFGFQSTGIVALEFGESTNYTWESEPASRFTTS